MNEKAAPLTNAVLDFKPSRHGLHFLNSFASGRVQRLFGVGGATMGLCGGMSFVVRDLFDQRIDPPPDTTAPVRGTPYYRSLFRRQLESFDWLRLPLRFWTLIALHRDPATWWSRLLRRRPRGQHSIDREWPRIRAEIDAGRLAQVGVIRDLSANPFNLTRNHQVLAYGYRVEPGGVTIRIYEPNWPDRDDVELRADLSGGTPRLSQSTGESLHALFLTRFRPSEPRAWRTPS